MTKGFQNNRLLKWSMVIAWVSILGWLTIRLADRAVLPMYDFLEYWSAGRLQLTGNNPYSPEQLLALQQSIGWPWGGPLMMWNPPWTLFFVIPFSLLSFNISRVVWLWLNLALVLFCTDWAWRFYGGPSRHRWSARLVSFTFLPTLLALYLGQVGLLILAGVVGFLHFERRRQWWLAGAATVLIAIKPQLLYLFWVALLLWAWDRRQWSVVLSSALAGLIATAGPLTFNLHVVNQYLRTTLSEPPLYWMTPTFSTVLRRLFGPDTYWLQLVPTAVGTLWFVFYWRGQRHSWEWGEQMPVLLLASLVTTPHKWTHDQVVLLPAVIQATAWVFHSGRRLIPALAAVIYFAMNVFAVVSILPSGDYWRVWMTPALLLIYLALQRHARWATTARSTPASNS